MSAGAEHGSTPSAPTRWQPARGQQISPMNDFVRLLKRFRAPLTMALAVAVVLSGVAAGALVLLGDWWRARGAGGSFSTQVALAVLAVASVLALWLLVAAGFCAGQTTPDPA